MRPATPARGGNTPRTNDRFGFRRALLPSAVEYFQLIGVKLKGGGAWRDAVCPFHDDTSPSLRVRVETGAFRCMVCGAHGGDVLDFHMKRTGLTFKAAAKDLGAWEVER
jgi:DNA primase